MEDKEIILAGLNENGETVLKKGDNKITLEYWEVETLIKLLQVLQKA